MKKEGIRKQPAATWEQGSRQSGNPILGRFLQEDVCQGDGLNLYVYCRNNPVVYYDPSGYNEEITSVTCIKKPDDDKQNKNSGKVEFKAPPDATAEEIEQVKQYVAGCNKALAAGALSKTGRVSTKGRLRRQASRSALRERKTAIREGRPYSGQAGHVPDTTWTNNPEPFSWLDLDERVNTSLGAQSKKYSVGYKPTEFVYKEDD